MDPISAMMGITSLVGIGMSFSASQKASEIAGMEANDSQMISQFEEDVNKQRHQQMLLEGQRQQLQQVRNAQLARSMALNSAVSQGAQYGSGIQGGFGQISGQSQNNLLALSQNVSLGNKVYQDNQDISSLRAGISELQGEMGNAQGDMAMGRAITSMASPLSKFVGSVPGMLSNLGGLFG